MLSGFTSPSSKRRRHEHDISIKRAGEVVKIRVPVLEINNIGEDMALDEKMIGTEVYSLLTNRADGKLAMIARTHKAQELIQILGKYHSITYKVKSMTRDLSNTYDWVSRQIFPRASQIADKFHIIKHVLDAMQDVRIRYRQELWREKRIKFEAYLYQEQERKAQCKEQGVVYKKSKYQYEEKTAHNGETYLKLLARSRHSLFKLPSDWTDSQKERSLALFKAFPEIKYAHHLCSIFRMWYNKYNIGLDINILQQKLKQWYKEVDIMNVAEMCNVKSMIQRNEGIILNYFKNGATNAIAENINSRIQRFYNLNNGARDIEFFFHRIKKFFA